MNLARTSDFTLSPGAIVEVVEEVSINKILIKKGVIGSIKETYPSAHLFVFPFDGVIKIVISDVLASKKMKVIGRK